MGVLAANPLLRPDLYDKLLVMGVANPGIFQLSGGDRPYNWDVKQTAGAQGSTITYRGWKLSDGIKGKFLLWLPEHFDEFYSVYYPLLQYDATKTSPKPVDVFHPVLAANDIYSCVTNNMGPLTHEGQQLWTVAIDLIEYRPAKKANVTNTPKSTGTATPDKKAQNPSAADQQDIEIQQLLAEARKPVP